MFESDCSDLNDKIYKIKSDSRL